MLGLAVKGRLFLAAAGFRYALGTGLSALGINLPYFPSATKSGAIAAAVYSQPQRLDRKDTQARDLSETDSADPQNRLIVARLAEQAAAIISRAFERITAASVSPRRSNNAR